MIPYLHLVVILILGTSICILHYRGIHLKPLNEPIPNPNSFYTSEHEIPLTHLKTLSSMSHRNFIHEHPVFGLSLDLAIAIEASMFTDILDNCLCKECGKHFVDASTIMEYVFDNVDEWSKTDKERSYLLFVLGVNILGSNLWGKLLKCKTDDHADTTLNIVALLREVAGLSTNTLHQN